MSLYYGFELLRDQHLPELNTRARFYRHLKTGAELLSLENRDENKVFGITFRTPPNDSTGLPHIMEHSVLCGSRKYPVKEPFVELMKGSLNTFLNAMTFPDKTCYPVASQNLQDFYNLIDVYMDAVFYPLIAPETLQQEGWHFELDDLDAPLTYKGVVFNEMKGAYSAPESLMAKHVQETLFSGHVYGLDSGGDPAIIPSLTYEQFKNFHDTYYHPSNARIYFYGDDDPEERLRRMDATLSEFDTNPVDSAIPPFPLKRLQPHLEQPARPDNWVEFPYDVGQETDLAQKFMLTENWLLADTGAEELALAFRILNHILIGTPAAPLRKALIDSGLGEDLVGVGLENDLRQSYFSTGLKGIKAESAEDVSHLILATLRSLAQEGIDPDTVAASVNTIEFGLRENNTGQFPQGLLLMLRSLSTWLYDQDPIKPLAFEAPLAAIKTRLVSGEPYFENLIRAYLLENVHTAVLLKPDPALNHRLEAEEAERLAHIRSQMSNTKLEGIVAIARRLHELQEAPDSPEALAAIPSLTLEDLDQKNKIIPLQVTLAGPERVGARLLYHNLFTNGILYLDLGFDLHSLPQEYLPWTTLFGRALLEMGTEVEDFVKLSQRIGRTTGGIRPAAFTAARRREEYAPGTASMTGRDGEVWLFLRGKATVAQSAELFNILKDILLTVRLDQRQRFRQIVMEEKADQEAGLAPMGHRVVNTRLRALFDEAGWAAEQISGLNYLFFLRQLIERIDQDWVGVLQGLETMRHILVNKNGMLLNATLDEENWQAIQPELDRFLDCMPAAAVSRTPWQPQQASGAEGLTIPAQVNFVGKGAALFELGYSGDGSVQVIANYLRTTYLWERIRVQGGAYGGFCLFDNRSGVFTYLSYRDPNILETLQNYDGAADFLRNLDQARLNAQELTKSIIGTIGDMDAYQLPDAKGYTSLQRYLTGEADEIRQKQREQVLAASLQDFHRFGEVLTKMNKVGQVVVLGSPDAIESANQQFPKLLKILKVL